MVGSFLVRDAFSRNFARVQRVNIVLCPYILLKLNRSCNESIELFHIYEIVVWFVIGEGPPLSPVPSIILENIWSPKVCLLLKSLIDCECLINRF